VAVADSRRRRLFCRVEIDSKDSGGRGQKGVASEREGKRERSCGGRGNEIPFQRGMRRGRERDRRGRGEGSAIERREKCSIKEETSSSSSSSEGSSSCVRGSWRKRGAILITEANRERGVEREGPYCPFILHPLYTNEPALGAPTCEDDDDDDDDGHLAPLFHMDAYVIALSCTPEKPFSVPFPFYPPCGHSTVIDLGRLSEEREEGKETSFSIL